MDLPVCESANEKLPETRDQNKGSSLVMVGRTVFTTEHAEIFLGHDLSKFYLVIVRRVGEACCSESADTYFQGNAGVWEVGGAGKAESWDSGGMAAGMRAALRAVLYLLSIVVQLTSPIMSPVVEYVRMLVRYAADCQDCISP
jgi:hypothetical protein